MSDGRYFEDLAVGQTFRSKAVRIEKDRMIAFAQEFDPQPQHVSEQAAAASQFGRLVASGWHTAAPSPTETPDAAQLPSTSMPRRL
jgi:acyl dehydratase